MFTLEMVGQSDAAFTFDKDDIPFHSGRCDADVEIFCEKYAETLQVLTREFCINALVCTGGWNREELAKEDDTELLERVVWLAAGNAYDAIEDGSDVAEGYVSTY